MRTLTLLIYALLGILLTWFAVQNVDRAELWLPGGYEAYWPLGAYIITALLLGALPMAILHSVSRWRWKRRIRKLELQLANRADTSLPLEPGRERSLSDDRASAPAL